MEFYGKSRQVPGNVPKKVVLGLEDCHRYKQDEKVFTQHPRARKKSNQILADEETSERSSRSLH